MVVLFVIVSVPINGDLAMLKSGNHYYNVKFQLCMYAYVPSSFDPPVWLLSSSAEW